MPGFRGGGAQTRVVVVGDDGDLGFREGAMICRVALMPSINGISMSINTQSG